MHPAPCPLPVSTEVFTFGLFIQVSDTEKHADQTSLSLVHVFMPAYAFCFSGLVFIISQISWGLEIGGKGRMIQKKMWVDID